MPLYDYSCPSCGAVQENVLHSSSELENPSKETLEETTCYCKKEGVRMLIAYLTPPAVKTPTRTEFLHADRKKRNKKHFVKNDLPTIRDKDAQLYHRRKLGYKH